MMVDSRSELYAAMARMRDRERVDLPDDQARRLLRVAERMLNARFPGRPPREDDAPYAADTVEMEGWAVYPLRLPELGGVNGGGARAVLRIGRGDGAVFALSWFWSAFRREWTFLGPSGGAVDFLREDEGEAP